VDAQVDADAKDLVSDDNETVLRAGDNPKALRRTRTVGPSAPARRDVARLLSDVFVFCPGDVVLQATLRHRSTSTPVLEALYASAAAFAVDE
jgi:hypothetical protein